MSRRFWGIVAVAVAAWVGVVAWSYWNTPAEEVNVFDSSVVSLAKQITSIPEPVADGKYPGFETFFMLMSPERANREAALAEIDKRWQLGNAVMLLEISRQFGPRIPARYLEVLQRKTGKTFNNDPRAWYDYLWQQEYEPHPQYASFKSIIYSRIDQRFQEYFADDYPSTIRLDEVLWGGVARDGIPPLKNPRMIAAEEANYLADSNVVFGISINGDARAYPKRILAWHEMFKDTIGGVSINGVYCTLCGSMIAYETHVGEQHHELGTSGFLYRSNKLMYDHATKSMWSTLTGEPTIGPLVGQGIKLERLHVVTTTWGEWRRRHPETTVLALNTGYRRDYGEGVAYRDYFATDELMFRVPFHDKRLKNKQEVLALRFDEVAKERLAIDADYLSKRPVYHGELGKQAFLVLTDPTGANRVYDPQGVRFVEWDGDSQAVDESGGSWQVTEAEMTSEQGQTLPRLPAHRAFWFGWHAAFPETKLISDLPSQ